MDNKSEKLKEAEVQTVVQCPHCNEPFRIKSEQTRFTKNCVFCRRPFRVINRKKTYEDA